ncbi:MAG TPA: tetratricopeptide repeat protein [Thioalkalivibrio sp.]|nr:tetratricopeptide repeat protein [Thioalkalivibrio sp.]
MSEMIARFEAMLESGQDSAMLRLALANALVGDGRMAEAIQHLEQALELDAGYSAAWKLLAKTLLAVGQPERVLEVCAKGVEVAAKKGDLQAAREMEVYAKRARRQRDEPLSDA